MFEKRASRASSLVRSVAAALLLTMSLSACYQYFPISDGEPLPEPGREVRARLSPEREMNLGNITVNQINRIDGSVYSNGNDSLALWTQWVHSAFGQRYYANGSVFYFPRQEMSRLEERRLVPVKTGFAVGAGVAALALIFGLATQLGGGEGNDEGPGPQLRIGIPLR